MAAQNLNIALPKETWTQLSNANITALTVQNIGTDNIRIMGTVGAVAPIDIDDGILLKPGERINSSVSLAVLFPGVAATRIYAYAVGVAGGAFVSHA
jgi:hypothetical protein